MTDEPSNGELWRLIEAMRGDVREDMAQINVQLGKLVSSELYLADKARIERDISGLSSTVDKLATKQQQDIDAVNRQRVADAERVTQTRRWLVASVIIPLLGLVLPVILFMAGGKS